MKYAFLALGILLGQVALAGTRDGGGGKGVICETPKRVRTLDLWEAENIRHLKPTGSETDLRQNLETFGLALWKHRAPSPASFADPKLPSQIRELLLGEVFKRFAFIPSGKRLEITNDATLPKLPPSCRIIQIAVYEPDDSIQVDREYWHNLNAQEQAALLLHEYIYHQARGAGAVNSDESRYVIGLIFAGTNPEPMFSPIWASSKRLACQALEAENGAGVGTFQMYAVEEQKAGVSGVGLYFNLLNRRSVSTRTAGFIPNLTLDQLRQENFGHVSGTVDNSFLQRTWQINLEGRGDGLLVSLAGESQQVSVGWCELASR